MGKLRRSYAENDYAFEDGSVEAEEAMAREGAARRRRERLGLAGNNETPSARQDRDRADLPNGVLPWQVEDSPTLDGAA